MPQTELHVNGARVRVDADPETSLLSVLRDTQLGALEAVSYHLREKRQLSFREIGDLLCRHENTIRTAHQRARFKHLMKV